MAATKYGNGNYGITNESSKGLYIQGLSLSASEDVVELPDHIGEVTGVVMYNQNATITGNGATTTADTQGQTLGGILDVASASIFGTDTTVTKFYVSSVELTDSNTDFQQGSFTAQGWLGGTATSGTNIT